MKKKLYIVPETSVTEMIVVPFLAESLTGRIVTTESNVPEGIYLDNIKGDNGDAYNDAASNDGLWGWGE